MCSIIKLLLLFMFHTFDTVPHQIQVFDCNFRRIFFCLNQTTHNYYLDKVDTFLQTKFRESSSSRHTGWRLIDWWLNFLIMLWHDDFFMFCLIYKSQNMLWYDRSWYFLFCRLFPYVWESPASLLITTPSLKSNSELKVYFKRIKKMHRRAIIG